MFLKRTIYIYIHIYICQLAPASLSTFTTLVCLQILARVRELRPLISLELTSAPFSTNTLTTSRCPFCEATIMGYALNEFSGSTLTSAPPSFKRNLTTSM
eukprot:GHVR01155149.1.p1 GENE.GHVR01155149.1~~GHVR01155149.1.p1  ORF type:complete len:100 (-),score=8.28 GHVR01155149.1:43-342(-)